MSDYRREEDCIAEINADVAVDPVFRTIDYEEKSIKEHKEGKWSCGSYNLCILYEIQETIGR